MEGQEQDFSNQWYYDDNIREPSSNNDEEINFDLVIEDIEQLNIIYAENDFKMLSNKKNRSPQETFYLMQLSEKYNTQYYIKIKRQKKKRKKPNLIVKICINLNNLFLSFLRPYGSHSRFEKKSF